MSGEALCKIFYDLQDVAPLNPVSPVFVDGGPKKKADKTRHVSQAQRVKAEPELLVTSNHSEISLYFALASTDSCVRCPVAWPVLCRHKGVSVM